MKGKTNEGDFMRYWLFGIRVINPEFGSWQRPCCYVAYFDRLYSQAVVFIVVVV